MSKYNILWDYVQKQNKPSLTLTFEEIQNIAGRPLDHSFLTCKKELTEYGYQVGKISMKQQTVHFDKIRAVIFDMDGVIFDSERAVYQCWQELARTHHLADLDTAYYKCIGVNSQMCRQVFMAHFGADFPYDDYTAEVSSMYHAKYDHGRLPLKPGVKELLSYLKKKSFQTAIASSTRTSVVEQQIADAGLRAYFDIIVGGDMVGKSKPEPDIFLKAAGLLHVLPEDAYVIEDSFNGIRAASSAGMIPVMVPDMMAPDEEMQQKARYILKDLFEVKKLL